MEFQGGPCETRAFVCPEGDGSWLFVNLVDESGEPLSDVVITAEFDAECDMCICSPLTAVTDLSGEAFLNIQAGLDASADTACCVVTTTVTALGDTIPWKGTGSTIDTRRWLSPDLNGDCLVGIFDQAILQSDSFSEACRSDLNCDGSVDFVDLGIFAQHINHTCTPPRSGACCLENDSCAVMIEADCGVLGGEFQGDDTDCDPNPCVVLPLIVTTSPAQNELGVSVSTDVIVQFNIDMDETTLNDTTFVVTAWISGLHQGSIAHDSETMTVTLNPAQDFDVGEVVTVVLTSDIKSSEGIALGAGYVWSFTVEAGEAPATFAVDWPPFRTGNTPLSLYAADLDGSLGPDLAVTVQYPHEVWTLLNKGDRTFSRDSTYAVGDRPIAVFATDLDTDGDLDLATANLDGNTVSILLGNGDGTFTFDTDYAVGTTAHAAYPADLDRDGDPDLAVPNLADDTVWILLNDGVGGFSPDSVYDVGNGPHGLSAGDLDGDGDIDLATCNSEAESGDVSILLNNGDGTFAPQTTYDAGSDSRSVCVADLDIDGDLDLAVANRGSDDVSVLKNNGDGTFASASAYPAGDGPSSLSVADLDGDTDLDMAVANHLSDDVSIFLNNGDGTFLDHGLISTGGEAYSIAAADLDEDGDVDLAVVNKASVSIIVLSNRRAGNHADHDVGNCVLTMTDQGILGFMSASQTEGSGFIYPAGGANQLFIGSLWVGNEPGYVANRDYDNDPIKEWVVSDEPDGRIVIEEGRTADQVIRAGFNDDEAIEPRGYYVSQESWAFAEPPWDNFVIIRYFIHNQSDAELTDTYAGVFLDPDLGEPFENTGSTDVGGGLVYVTGESGLYVGLRHLCCKQPTANITLIRHHEYSVFMPDSAKYGFLQGADSSYVIHDGPELRDYSLLASAGPFNLAPGESTEVAFAVIGGEDLSELLANAEQAQIAYLPPSDAPDLSDDVVRETRLLVMTPNPFSSAAAVRYELAQPTMARLAIYDAGGRLVRTLAQGHHDAGRYSVPWDGRGDGGHPVASGVYFYRLEAGKYKASRRMLLLR